MEWILEVVLIALLAATLFYAARLERALGALKRDRAALEELVAGFDSSTRLAEQGLEKLRATSDGAGRHISRQLEAARTLKDDLAFLLERGERAADRLESMVRTARPMQADARVTASAPPRAAVAESPRTGSTPADAAEPRLRSQAERDLLKVLRMAR